MAQEAVGAAGDQRRARPHQDPRGPALAQGADRPVTQRRGHAQDQQHAGHQVAAQLRGVQIQLCGQPRDCQKDRHRTQQNGPRKPPGTVAGRCELTFSDRLRGGRGAPAGSGSGSGDDTPAVGTADGSGAPSADETAIFSVPSPVPESTPSEPTAATTYAPRWRPIDSGAMTIAP